MRTIALLFGLIAGAASAELVTIPGAEVQVSSSCEDRLFTWQQPDVVTYWDVEVRRIFTVGPALRFETAVVKKRVEFSAGPQLVAKVPRVGLFQVRVRACRDGDAVPCSPWSESTDASSVLDGAPFVVSVFLCPPTGGIDPN